MEFLLYLLRLYSQLNDFLNTCRKRKTAIGLTAVLLRLVSVRNTQYHSIQSHRHRLECYSSILSISSYPLLSVLPLHPASLPFPLSDIPPYHEPKYQFRQGVHITFRLSAECNIKLACVLSNSVSLTARILKGENFSLLSGRDNSNLR